MLGTVPDAAVWAILFLPLVSLITIFFAFQKSDKAGWVSAAAIGSSFLLSLVHLAGRSSSAMGRSEGSTNARRQTPGPTVRVPSPRSHTRGDALAPFGGTTRAPLESATKQRTTILAEGRASPRVTTQRT